MNIIIILSSFFMSVANAADYSIQTNSVEMKNNMTGFVANVQITDHSAAIPANAGIVRMKIKGILFPLNASGLNQAEAVALPAQEIEVDFSSGSQAVVQYNFDQPFMAGGDFLFGAIVNSDQTIQEDTRDNNLTEDLVAITLPDHQVGVPPTDQAFDLYSTVVDLSPSSGVAGHAWRLFARGDWPETYELFAFFGFVDLKQAKFYPGHYDKHVGWIDMGQEVDAQGRTVPYDSYYNSPVYNTLPSGTYHMLTWINEREGVLEDGSNNAHLEKITVQHAKSADPEMLNFHFAAAETNPLAQTVMVVSDFASAIDWSIIFPVASGVTFSRTFGQISENGSGSDLTITVDPSQFNQPMTVVPVTLQVLDSAHSISEQIVLNVNVFKD